MTSNQPVDWEEIQLGELFTAHYGKSLTQKNRVPGKYKVYGSSGITGTHNEFLVKGPGLIIGRKGTIGNVYYEKNSFYPIDTTYYVKESNRYDLLFLYYKLKTLDLDKMNTHSAVPGLNREQLYSIKTKFPKITEQKAIANILSTLDEKIETNNQINEKLEEMAQALFKHWFVDFEFPNENGEPYKSSGGEMVESELGMIPKGWRVVKLKEIIEFIKNSTKPGEQLNNRKYVPIDTMPIKKLILNSYKSYKEAKSSLILFEKYDILIGAMRVYFHRVNLAPFRGVTRTTTFVLRSKSLEDISYNLLLLNMPSTISYADQSSIGSTIPYAVWEGGLGEMLLAQPPIEIRKKFNNVIFPLLEKMILNSQQNIRIQKIRDTLLPKLMSGEIRVPVEEEK
ncbi:Type I restriction-modification system, specificity subunit S [Caldibacillus thermoamylovorans]|uniref:restriction endonuclease subunit S n=1 Tax=Caldibacillus thermoamylovorans TaxID=35841 RepID=UPI0005A45579|nr:restriction endonuclease subunit S [Caldibacillus thermoamylovorans]KIO60982.1 Type I restriction-modification system, specificity subunit S [Caldibacillus thermoamylovorans]